MRRESGWTILLAVGLGVGWCFGLYHLWFFTSTTVSAESWRGIVLVAGWEALVLWTVFLRVRPLWWLLAGVASLGICVLLVSVAWPLRNETGESWFPLTSPGDSNVIFLPWLHLVFCEVARRIRLVRHELTQRFEEEF